MRRYLEKRHAADPAAVAAGRRADPKFRCRNNRVAADAVLTISRRPWRWKAHNQPPADATWGDHRRIGCRSASTLPSADALDSGRLRAWRTGHAHDEQHRPGQTAKMAIPATHYGRKTPSCCVVMKYTPSARRAPGLISRLPHLRYSRATSERAAPRGSSSAMTRLRWLRE